MSYIRTSFFSFVLLLVVAGTPLSGCSNKTPFEPKTLRINIGTEPPSLDWHVTTDGTSFDVISNIMVGLTQYHNDLSCAPCVAKSWDVLDGGKRYVFHLRDDCKWSDGKPVTACDFEYSWQRLCDPRTGASYASFLYDVVNAPEINSGKIADVTQLAAHALDDHTFEVRLRKPAAYFIYLTAGCVTYPLRKDIVEKHKDRWTEPENILTNGPFLLSKWQHEYKIELTANKNYFEGAPALDKVKMFMVAEQSTAFALYENDQFDYVENRSLSTADIDRMRDTPDFKTIPLLRSNYLGFNVGKKPFDDARVRRAFAMAIDKTVFPKILRRGEHPVQSWLPEPLQRRLQHGSGTEMWNDTLPFDPKAARALLAQAGFPGGKGFPHVDLLYPNREDSRLVVESIQAQLKKNLGVSIELMNQELKVYFATRRKDPPPLFRATWGADFPDAETFMNVFESTNGNNVTRWKNSYYDTLVKAGAGEQDDNVRAQLYRRADKLLCSEEAPIVPLFLATNILIKKSWTHGIEFNAIDIQYLKSVSVGKNSSSNPALKGGVLEGSRQRLVPLPRTAEKTPALMPGFPHARSKNKLIGAASRTSSNDAFPSIASETVPSKHRIEGFNNPGGAR